MTNKEINSLIDKLAYGEDGDRSYELRFQLMVEESELSLEEARARISAIPLEEQHLYTITTSPPPSYIEDLNLSLAAAKRISEKNNYTFVLSIEDGIWVACYGDFSDFADHRDQNPSYAVCMSILKFMGKV